MFKTKRIVIFLVAFVFSLVIAGCGGSTEKPKESTSNSPQTPPAQQTQQAPKAAIRGVTADTIKLGDIIDLSGPTSVMGVTRKVAMELWVKKVNDSGGINGRKIEYKVEDGQYDPAKEAAAYKKLIEKDQVYSVLSSWSSGAVMALLDQVERDKNIFLPQAMITGALMPAKKWVFHTGPPYASYYNAMVDKAIELSKGGKIGVLYADNPFSQDGWKTVQARAEAKGAKALLVPEVFNFNDIDATSQITNLKKANVSVLLMVETTQPNAVIFKAIDQLNFDKPILMNANGTEPPMIKLSGNTKALKQAIGIQGTATFLENAPGAKAIMDLAAKYGVDKTLYTTQWFVIPWTEALLFEDALKKAGDNLDPENVRNIIESTKNFDTKGLMDLISFSPDKHYGSEAVKFVKANVAEQQFESASDWIRPGK